MMRRTNTLLVLHLSLLLVVGSAFPSVRAFEAMRTTSTTNSSNTTESPSPTISPFPTISPQPTPNNSSSSEVPTISPGNNTMSPGPSIPPSMIPTTPSQAPTTAAPTSKAPTLPPTTMTPTHTPTLQPVTSAPTQAPTPHHHKKKQHPSLLRILGKTIAWLFIIALALLGFGFLMSNRYRIYYYIRSAWYRFLQLPCTIWLLRKTGLSRLLWQQDDLNEIIFDNDLNEGLLLQDT